MCVTEQERPLRGRRAFPGPCASPRAGQAPVQGVIRSNGDHGEVTSLCWLELFSGWKINNSLSPLCLFCSYNNLISGWQTRSFHFPHDLKTSSSRLFCLVALGLKPEEDWTPWTMCGCCTNTVHGCFTQKGKNGGWGYGWQLQSWENMTFLRSN